MKWRDKPAILRERRADMDGNRLFLGSYVETDAHRHRGRITQFHDSCPEGAAWLMGQEDGRVRDLEDNAWASVLVHPAGSVVVPVSLMRKVEPFEFTNPWADDYWEEYA